MEILFTFNMSRSLSPYSLSICMMYCFARYCFGSRQKWEMSSLIHFGDTAKWQRHHHHHVKTQQINAMFTHAHRAKDGDMETLCVLHAHVLQQKLRQRFGIFRNVRYDCAASNNKTPSLACLFFFSLCTDILAGIAYKHYLAQYREPQSQPQPPIVYAF